MYKKTGFGEAALFGAALIWGTGFVAQSLGSDTLSPFTYNGVRNVIGSVTLLIFLRLFNKKRGGTPDRKQYLPILKGGAVCGFLLFCAANLQQISISWVDENGQKALVGKIGFLTSLYIVLVPVLGLLFGKKTRPMMWLGVLIALIGAYLLTDLSQGFSLGTADALALADAADALAEPDALAALELLDDEQPARANAAKAATHAAAMTNLNFFMMVLPSCFSLWLVTLLC